MLNRLWRCIGHVVGTSEDRWLEPVLSFYFALQSLPTRITNKLFENANTTRSVRILLRSLICAITRITPHIKFKTSKDKSESVSLIQSERASICHLVPGSCLAFTGNAVVMGWGVDLWRSVIISLMGCLINKLRRVLFAYSLYVLQLNSFVTNVHWLPVHMFIELKVLLTGLRVVYRIHL